MWFNRGAAVKQDIQTYVVLEAYTLGGRWNIIEVGYMLRECYNGWYQVYREDGRKECYTIAPEVFSKIKCKKEDGEKIHNTHSESKPVDVPPGQLFA